MLSVKQGGIKYHFYSLWYDSTWDWTQVSRAIGEHSNRWAKVFNKNALRMISRVRGWKENGLLGAEKEPYKS